MKVFAILSLFLILVAYSFAADDFVHFYDHSVIRVNLINERQVELVASLNLDVWSENLVLGKNDVMVDSSQEMIIKHSDIDYEVLIPDVESVIQEERTRLQSRNESQVWPQASFFDDYHNLSDIYAYYESLAKSYPSIATYIPSIGKSIESRDIPAFTIGKSTATKKIYFQGGQHAREWINHATTAYIATQLVTLYSSNAVVKELVDNIQYVIVPVVNPDGYVFTWGSNRLWRKNRRLNSGNSYGVDLNRNWNDHWGGAGSSSSPSSDTYHGASAFSEPETKAVSAFILSKGPFALAVDYHSYSQLILRPYGWTTARPTNDATAKLVGDGIRDAIYGSHKVRYTSEASWELYATTGTASDWFFGPGKVPLSYTIELRDLSTFVLPKAQIIPTGEENWAGALYYSTYVLKN